MLLHELLDGFQPGLIQGNAQHDEPLVFEFLMDFLQRRPLCSAMVSPGSPEVQQHQASLEAAQSHFRVVESSNGEIGSADSLSTESMQVQRCYLCVQIGSSNAAAEAPPERNRQGCDSQESSRDISRTTHHSFPSFRKSTTLLTYCWSAGSPNEVHLQNLSSLRRYYGLPACLLQLHLFARIIQQACSRRHQTTPAPEPG